MAIPNIIIEDDRQSFFRRSATAPASGTGLPDRQLVVASVTGPHNLERLSPCQDAWSYCVHGDTVVAVVCDGAGSAPRARLGAQVGSGLLSRTVGRAKADPASHKPEERTAWRVIVEQAVERARRLSSWLTARNGDGVLDDCHATVVGVVASGQGGFFLHIGDGIGLACSEAGRWSDCVVSPPENGEYANETFFYTEAHWRQHLRITPFGPSEVVLLMSDGPMPFVVEEDHRGIKPGFANPLAAHLARVTPATAAQDLADTLNDSQAQRISGDDKTLLWIRFDQAK